MTSFLAAAQTMRLDAGEEIRFDIAGNGALTPGERREIKPNGYERAVGAEFAAGKHDDATGANAKPIDGSDGSEGSPPIPEPGHVRVRFTRLAEKHALLVLENGYSDAMVYRASITVKGRTVPSDVCLIMPGKIGVEHWPYPVDTIEMRDVRLVAWKPSDGIRCE